MERRQTEPYISAYLHGKGRRLGLPIGGTFELTARCNFNCPMCYVHLSREDQQARGRELTAGQWIDLARQARDAGMVFALLTGGEPFVREDFFEIYSAMKAMGLLISINSNGSMLQGEILEKLLADPPFRINISLYGGSEETYRNMCGQNAFDRVVENIRALRQAGVDVRLNLSITPYNVQDLEKILRLSRQLQVHVKASGYMYPPMRVDESRVGTGNRLTEAQAAASTLQWDAFRLTEEEFSQRAEALHRLQGAQRDCPMELDEGIRCRAGSSSFWLTWDGKMTPCGMMPHPAAYPLQDGFPAAWQQILEETKKIRTPKECAACPKREACSVCAAVCLTETGRFDGVPQYMCRMTQELIDQTWRAYRERKE